MTYCGLTLKSRMTNKKNPAIRFYRHLAGFLLVLFCFNKSIGKSSCLDICEHGIGIGLDAERPDLNAIELFWFGRHLEFRWFRCNHLLLHVGAECVHGLAKLGEPVHHIGVVAGDAALVPFGMSDEHTVLFQDQGCTLSIDRRIILRLPWRRTRV